MEREEPFYFQLDNLKNVSDIIQFCRELMLEHKFPQLEIEQFLLAISEISNNAIRHGGGGRLILSVKKNGAVISVRIEDDGPGIANYDLAMREGYSTVKTSLGLGLTVAQRTSDYFFIESSDSSGTAILIEKYRPLFDSVVSYGLVSVPDEGYNFNGDTYVLKEYDGDSVLIGVIDGPGQGYDAYVFAHTCKEFIESNYRLSLDNLMYGLDLLLKESNDQVGITASLFRVKPYRIEYKGCGDTHAYLVKDGEVNRLINDGGRLGQLLNFKKGIKEYSFENQLRLVLCTDGISTLPHSMDLSGTTQHVANTLFDAYHKPNGDATVLTMKYSNP